jgi:hypothetical protein
VNLLTSRCVSSAGTGTPAMWPRSKSRSKTTGAL